MFGFKDEKGWAFPALAVFVNIGVGVCACFLLANSLSQQWEKPIVQKGEQGITPTKDELPKKDPEKIEKEEFKGKEKTDPVQSKDEKKKKLDNSRSTAGGLLAAIEKLEGGKGIVTKKTLETIIDYGDPGSPGVAAAQLKHTLGTHRQHEGFMTGLGPVLPLPEGWYAAKDRSGSIATKPEGAVRCLFLAFEEGKLAPMWLEPNPVRPIEQHDQWASGEPGYYLPLKK